MAATPARPACAPCEIIAGLNAATGPLGAHQAAGVALDLPEQCSATEHSDFPIVTHSVTSVGKVASLEQSRLYEGMEHGPGVRGEIPESEGENGCISAPHEYRHSESTLATAISASALGQAIPPALLPVTPMFPALTAETPPQADSTRSPEQLTAAPTATSLPMPTVQAATAVCLVGAPAGNSAAVAAATDASTYAIKRTHLIARTTSCGESFTLAAPGVTAALSAAGQDLHTRRNVNSVYNPCLSEAYGETCVAATISTTERGRQVALQLTSQNTLSSGSRSTRNRRGMNGDVRDIAYCRLKTRRAVTTAGGGVAASAFSSFIPPMCVLPPDIAASRAPSPAAGNACPSPLPFAAAQGPGTGDLLRAAVASSGVAHSATCKTEDCSMTGRACPTHIPLQRYLQRQQHPQQTGDFDLIHQFPLQAQRQPVQYRPAEKQQQLPRPSAQPSVLDQPDQKQQLDQTPREQHFQGKQLYTERQQRLQQQMQQPCRSQELSQHKSIRLFLLEDYDGPELPSGYPLMSLGFGTSSEEEEEEQHQQHDSANAARSHYPIAAAGETRLETSSLMHCAVLKKKKKRERKVSVGATDALWQPHFHPHNQEFRVRYRYKGSMRLKTLSCARFGREGARRLTVAFVQRWQKSGRRVAAKTHRSKLALSDLPPDIHLLPAYDRKRRGVSSVKGNDTIVSSYCSTSANTPSVPNCSGDCSGIEKFCTSQDRCSNSNRIVISIDDHCQKVGASAAHVLPSSSAATSAQTPAFSGLNRRVLPVFTGPRPLSLLEMLPSAAAAASAGACAPSTVFASATGSTAPAATVPYIPAAAALVSRRCDLCWSRASSETGAGTEHGKESTETLLTQRPVPNESSICDTATLSLESGHVLSSHVQDKCDCSPLFLTTTTSNRDTSSTSPATLFPHEGSSNSDFYSCGTQSTRRGDGGHLLHLYECSSEYCYPVSSTGPWSSRSQGYTQESNAGMSRFIVEKGIVASAPDSGAVAASAATGAAAELRGALDEENSAAAAVCHTGASTQGGTSAATTTYLLPVHPHGSPADSLYTPSSPASVSAVLALPETLSTTHLPAVSTQLSPAAAASATNDAAASTTEAVPSISRADARPRPALRPTCGEPATKGGARALHASLKEFPVVNVECLTATDTATHVPSAWVLPVGVLPVGDAT